MLELKQIKMIKYKLNKNTIIFNKSIKKGGNIKVYFHRNIDERETTDLPVATTNTDGEREYNWPIDGEILTIQVRQPKLFGLLKGKWEIAEKE